MEKFVLFFQAKLPSGVGPEFQTAIQEFRSCAKNSKRRKKEAREEVKMDPGW